MCPHKHVWHIIQRHKDILFASYCDCVDHSCIFVNQTFFLEETVCHVLWTLKTNNMRKKKWKNKQISWITRRCRLRRCLDGLGAAHRGLLGSWRPHLAHQISWSPRLVGCLNDTCQDLTTQVTMLPLSLCSNIQRRCKGCFLANLTGVFQCFFMCRIFATTPCWIIAWQCRALWLYNAD